MTIFKYGPQIGLVGGVFLTVAGIFELTCDFSLAFNMLECWYTHDSNSHEFVLLLISGLIALILGVIACIGAKLVLLDYNIGKYLLIISGIIASVGIFIPIGYSAKLGYLCRCPIYLVATRFIIEPFIVLIGGVFCIYKDHSTPIN